MKYPYIVNYKGTWYPAGTEVPVGVKKTAETKSEGTKDNDLTKTDINRMSTAELKELATKEGIDGAEDMTGAELKKVLISHFNL